MRTAVPLGGGVGEWEKARGGFQGPGDAPSLGLSAGCVGVFKCEYLSHSSCITGTPCSITACFNTFVNEFTSQNL